MFASIKRYAMVAATVVLGVAGFWMASTAAASQEAPSGATTYLKQVDQKLDKMDKSMSAESEIGLTGATSNLKTAQKDMETVESRYGMKMGKDHPELVARRDRIAKAVKSLEAYKVRINKATQDRDDEEKAAAAKTAADYSAEKARNEKETADVKAQWQKDEAAQDETTKKQEAERVKANEAAMKKAGQGEVGAGKILFSKTPLTPANPGNLATTFKAGDAIYGLILNDKPWRETYDAKGKSSLGLMIVMMIGDNETSQYITLKKQADIDAQHLVLDIAPALDKMTAYKDPGIEFGEGKGNRKIGPIAFTYELGQLPPGKHKVQFFIRNFGAKFAHGEFEIEGADFTFYADLHEKVTAAVEADGTLPAAGMVNKEFEAQMRKLLENAGWPTLLRLVIVDKDWWLVGQTSRYLNVAAAAKVADGKCYWCNVQFTQQRLISGGWGPFELTKTGIKRSIPEGNINK